MTEHLHHDRRALLALLAVSAATHGSPVSAASATNGMLTPVAALCAGAMNTDRESARRIGQQYLLAFPDEREAVGADARIADLVSLLAQGTSAERALRDMSAAYQAADFESGDVVHVAGWILSRLEARLCAACVLAGA